VADGPDLHIVDLLTPARPARKGSLSLGGTEVGVAVSGNYAYLTNQDNSFYVVDVSDAAAPVMRGATLLSGAGLLVSVDGTRAAALSAASAGDYLDILDITTPTAPRKVGFTLLGPPGTAKGVALVGNTAYVAGNGKRLMIYDIATPTALVLKGAGFSV